MRPNLCLPLAGLLLVFLGAVRLAAEDKLTFEQHVRPILKVYCLDCHGAEEKLEGNLDLRLVRLAAKGGDSGPAIVAGDVAKSTLLERVKAGEMPPSGKKVPAEQIAILEKWVATGAGTLRPEPEQIGPGVEISPEERAFWAFQPLRRPEPPAVDAGAHKLYTPIDRFLFAPLQAKGLAFAPEADKVTLIRRVALDLTGLPPSEPEIAEFVADTSEQAYEKMVDRYLASPHYGERWARHWLDVAGYAESEGNGSEDTNRPHAWRYRDYVIRSLNNDKPLNQFIIEQLAGDELVPQPWNNLTPDQVDILAATGFLRMAVDPVATGGDVAPGANQVVADTIKIVSSSLLGLSVGCAQCHDHKYDPIPQEDYFRLRAIFEPALDPAHWRRPAQRLVSLYSDADRAKAAAVDAEVKTMQAAYKEKQDKYVSAAFEKELLKFAEDQRPKLKEAYTTPADKRTDEHKQLLASNPKLNIHPGVLYQYDEAASNELKADQAKIAEKQKEKPVEQFVSVLNEVPGQLPVTKIFYRGDYRDPRAAVVPGDLTIAAPEGQRLNIAEKDANLPTSGRRLAFARHLTTGQHPLLGRVLVNRFWLHHFGRGFVETPGDFGFLGARPTNPELLDYLASELPNLGWSLKRLHKLILLSAVYRQSSQPESTQQENTAKSDPDNQLYSRFPLRRLDAEVLRDRILVVSGQLNRTMFGPPVTVEEDFVGQVIVKDEQPRRSIYVQNLRNKAVSFLTTFDAPVMAVNCERRSSSTGAQQSLMLMNSDFIMKQAGLLAERLRRETPPGLVSTEIEAVAARFARPASAWQFGYGGVDEASGRVVKFSPLPHFTGSSWQGGAALPDPTIGWVLITAAGGHPGNNAEYASIRRWTAPQAGVLAAKGRLKHSSENGDGVRGRIVSSRQGVLGDWSIKQGETATDATDIRVEPGEIIDFVVDCRGNTNADSFEWQVDLNLATSTDPAMAPLAWNSQTDFHGPATSSLPQQLAQAWRIVYQRAPSRDELELGCQFVTTQQAALQKRGDKGDHELTALTSLCQQLLSSNEFLYAD
jgi:hypothetical protein